RRGPQARSRLGAADRPGHTGRGVPAAVGMRGQRGRDGGAGPRDALERRTLDDSPALHTGEAGCRSEDRVSGFLELPEHSAKPRQGGITPGMDRGLSVAAVAGMIVAVVECDVIASLGW